MQTYRRADSALLRACRACGSGFCSNAHYYKGPGPVLVAPALGKEVPRVTFPLPFAGSLPYTLRIAPQRRVGSNSRLALSLPPTAHQAFHLQAAPTLLSRPPNLTTEPAYRVSLVRRPCLSARSPNLA